MDDGSHKGKVEEESDKVLLCHPSLTKVDQKLTQFEEKGNEHEGEHSSSPSIVTVLPELKEGEEVRSDVGTRDHRIGDNVEHPFL